MNFDWIFIFISLIIKGVKNIIIIMQLITEKIEDKNGLKHGLSREFLNIYDDLHTVKKIDFTT